MLVYNPQIVKNVIFAGAVGITGCHWGLKWAKWVRMGLWVIIGGHRRSWCAIGGPVVAGRGHWGRGAYLI